MTSDVMDEAARRRQSERVDVLRRAQHPGVAALVEDRDAAAQSGVTLDRHDGPRLGETELTIEEIAGVFAILATTVADLNDLGVQISVVTADGVSLGRDGRPVIVDLAAATTFDPRATRGGKTLNPDARAVGELLMQTLRRCAPDVLTGPTTGRWRRRPPALGQHVTALATAAARGAIPLRHLADGLVHPDARLPRPRAVPVETTPRATVGAATVDARAGHPAGDSVDPRAGDSVAFDAGAPVSAPERGAIETRERGDPPLFAGNAARQGVKRLLIRGRPVLARLELKRPSAGPWVRRGAIGALTVAGGVLVALGVAAIPGAPRPHTRLTPAGPATPTGTSVCLAVDASGSCTEPAAYAAGVLTTPTGRFAVGRPGDVVAAGRWSCGPVATLAMLRPDRGEVWIFPGWPSHGSVLTARLVGRVAQGRQLTAQADGACDALVVTRADSSTVLIDRRMFP